ncbi:MAG TPA: glycosyltransferase, partial [Geminicoccus sp.]|uniref:glycosyltransferase family 2 protein n=1 Tax=Geminicoccus sp. TaxID=2024832 RepID=UPI002E33CC90
VQEAIQSVQAQTMTDLELVISDNASTDRTGMICQDLAAADPRIRYFRNERNLGAGANYNIAFAKSRGTYFKWLAHDDRIKPGYLAATVAALDAAPDAVLCNTVVDYIGSQGQHIGLYDSGLSAADHPRPSHRFATMILMSHSCVDFFGVCRRDALVDSMLHGPFHGADRAFLAQMALRGRLLQVKTPLVEMREHEQRYTRSQHAPNARAIWHDATKAKRNSLPTWRLYREYLDLVSKEKLTPAERSACRVALVRWWIVNWNSIRASVDIGALAWPDLPRHAEAVKIRLFGKAPGHF